MAITLAKSGDKAKISLDKSQVARAIRINLKWSSTPVEDKRGFFASLFGSSPRKAEEVDLDLGVYVEGLNGQKTILDPLQSTFQRGNRGTLNSFPFVSHSGDDRAGGGGELVEVSSGHLSQLKRIVVYTFIYEGAAAWSKTDALVKIEVPGSEPVEVLMGQQSDSRTFCALASLTVDGGEQIHVERLMTFHRGHEECDRKYGWGFQWSPGSK